MERRRERKAMGVNRVNTGALGERRRERYSFEANRAKWVGPESIDEAIGRRRDEGERLLEERES